MENTKKYNRKRTLDITVMAMVVAIRLVMEMLPAIKFGVYVLLPRRDWTILHRIHIHSPCRRTHLRILLI